MNINWGLIGVGILNIALWAIAVLVAIRVFS